MLQLVMDLQRLCIHNVGKQDQMEHQDLSAVAHVQLAFLGSCLLVQFVLREALPHVSWLSLPPSALLPRLLLIVALRLQPACARQLLTHTLGGRS